MFIAFFYIVAYFQLRLGGVVPCSELIVSTQISMGDHIPHCQHDSIIIGGTLQ